MSAGPDVNRTSAARRRLGMRHRVYAVFLVGGLLLATGVGLVIWVLARGYLLDLRQASGARQAQATAVTVDRLLAPQDPGLPQQAQELAGVSESGILVLRGEQVLAATGLLPEQVPQRFRERVEAGQPVRQRVRIDGEVRLLIGLPLRTGAGYFQVLPLRELDRTLGRLRLVLLLAGATSAVLSLLLARLAIRGALRPVQELTDAAQAVARGELATRMPQDDRDLAELAAVFNETTADLERRVRASARFAATVSHELRTPLATMTNAVALLERRRAQLPEVAQEAVQLLDSQLERFRRLLLDLLDIAIVTEGVELALEPVDLAAQVRAMAAAEGWGPVETGPPVVVQADPRRLERVVANLVANAETHGRGVVRVAVLRGAGVGRLEVDDAGSGVPPEQRGRVFERFVRGPSADGQQPGFGLGLAFVAELTRLQHGRVAVEDRPGGGARFVVELPLAQPARQR